LVTAGMELEVRDFQKWRAEIEATSARDGQAKE
jgi:hypothetical protein